MTERSDDAALSDAALLERHAAGDPEAFGELFRRHRDRLWAVALRTVGDREEAADAVQDAFISAMRASAPTAGGTGKPAGASAAAFRGDSAVTTWLHRIVVNACLDRLRRRAVRPTDPLPVTEPRSPAPDAFAAADASFDVVAQATDQTGLVEIRPDEPAEARYLLVWLTAIPDDGSGYQGTIAEIGVRG